MVLQKVGKGKAAIVDTWWQTETGGFLCSTLPAIKPMKPGSAGPGMPGIHPIIYDDDGTKCPRDQDAGNICIQNPWPGAFQTIWGDRDRFVATYYARYCKNPKSKDWRDWPYLTGDAAVDGRRRLLPHPGPGRRRHQRLRPPPGHQGDRVGGPGGGRGGRGRGRAGGPRDQGQGAGPVRRAQTRLTGQPGTGQEDLRRHLAPRSARSPSRARSGSSRTCPRPAPARSCGGCWRPFPTTRMSAMSPPWPTLKSSRTSAKWQG
jgi:hypothetical protein